ncbi:MAG: hypothetical protein HS123_15615 [Solibacteraceae bacterium]|nr:hypothetical protein [Solibacteraceae bacterium]
MRVSALLDRGVQEARSLDAEPGVQAELYGNSGVLYQNLGDLGKAEQLLELASNGGARSSAKRMRRWRAVWFPWVPLRTTQARAWRKPEESSPPGCRMSRGSLPATHPEMARALSTLSEVLAARGSYPEAIEAGAEAARLAAGGPGEASLRL